VQQKKFAEYFYIQRYQ